MRFPSKRMEQLIKDHRSMLEIEGRKKHWVIKLDGQTVAVVSHGSQRHTKYRTVKNGEARLVRALREKGVDV